jgi:hypothetical protein
MVVLCCTQKLLVRLKRADVSPGQESTTRLGDWYGNILRIGRQQHLLFISEHSRLPVIIPIHEAASKQVYWQTSSAREPGHQLCEPHSGRRRREPLSVRTGCGAIRAAALLWHHRSFRTPREGRHVRLL